MIWSRRWRRWWGPSAGTPWRRPARASGPGSMLSSQLMAVLLNTSIVNMYICKFFYFIEIGWFSAVLFHLEERRKKFRIYRCHPVRQARPDSFCCTTRKRLGRQQRRNCIDNIGEMSNSFGEKSENGEVRRVWVKGKMADYSIFWMAECSALSPCPPWSLVLSLGPMPASYPFVGR